jgi:hypothetical protein
MNAFAQTRLAHMEHRQIVTQNATGMQRKHVVVLTPILFILLRILAVKIISLFIFFNKCSHLLF